MANGINSSLNRSAMAADSANDDDKNLNAELLPCDDEKSFQIFSTIFRIWFV